MTIEQRPELNRFVDPSIPITWAWRRRQFKFVLPIWCFIWACYLEMGITAAWLHDKLTLEFVADIISALLIFAVVMWVLFEILVRLRQRSKRILKVETRRIAVSPAKNGSVLWKKICRFHFEPIAQFPDGCRLLIFLRGFKGEKQVERPFWMMVLERSSQAHELASCLEAKRGETNSNFDIVTLSEPSPAAPITTFPPFGLSLYMGGIYLLLHGVPLLFVAIEKDHPHSASSPQMGPEAAAMVNEFVLRHFSNVEQFRHFFLTSSVCLIFTGIILLACGWWMMNRNTQVGPTLKGASIVIRKS